MHETLHKLNQNKSKRKVGAMEMGAYCVEELGMETHAYSPSVPRCRCVHPGGFQAKQSS